MDPTTSLAYTYQIIIRFDYGFQGMRKMEVQEAIKSRLEAMGILLALRYREPVSALLHKDTNSSLGILRITTSIMVRGLLLNVMQVQITVAIHKCLDPKMSSLFHMKRHRTMNWVGIMVRP